MEKIGFRQQLLESYMIRLKEYVKLLLLFRMIKKFQLSHGILKMEED